MDGVLADFRTAAAQANSLDPCEFLAFWNFHHEAELSDDEFWNNISADPDFWFNIEPYPWFTQLISVVENFDPHFCITTNPSRDPLCIVGKRAWIDKHLGETFSRVMFGPQKHLFAKPGAVLIDDFDGNISRFRAFGGVGITFPQPWNAGSGSLPGDRVEMVHQMLDTIATVEAA